MKHPGKDATNKEKFLYGLTKLTLKFGVEIAGCGCCGSPFLCPTSAKAGEYTDEGRVSFEEETS